VNLVGGIPLGRGEDDKTVHPWQTTAAGVLGFIGCAMGRMDFWEPAGAGAPGRRREAALDGSQHRLKVRGLDVVAVSIKQATAVGNVYKPSITPRSAAQWLNRSTL
jgi:hypothetical protein